MSEEHLKLFVTALPDDWDHDKIKEYFSAQASVLEVEVFTDQGRNLGCAYVQFAKKREAEDLMKKLSKEVILLRWADGEAERLAQVKEVPLPAKQENPTYVQYTSSDGTPYFYNTITGTTQWDVPKELSPTSAVNSANKFMGHSQGPAGCNLFIFHLPIEWTETELISYFSPFGNVISARIMCDKITGKSKGYGFVSYDNHISSINAVKMMNGCQVSGKRLKVQLKKGEGVPNYLAPYV